MLGYSLRAFSNLPSRPAPRRGISSVVPLLIASTPGKSSIPMMTHLLLAPSPE
jgi:hypothetical protein